MSHCVPLYQWTCDLIMATGNNHRTGDSVPLRADRWYQSELDQDQIVSSGDFGGIRINSWNRAKVRHVPTHSLAGGGSHKRGNHAFEMGDGRSPRRASANSATLMKRLGWGVCGGGSCRQPGWLSQRSCSAPHAGPQARSGHANWACNLVGHATGCATWAHRGHAATVLRLVRPGSVALGLQFQVLPVTLTHNNHLL